MSLAAGSSLMYLLSKIETISKLSIKIIIIAVLFRGKQGQSRLLIASSDRDYSSLSLEIRHLLIYIIYIEYYNRNDVETAYFETLSYDVYL